MNPLFVHLRLHTEYSLRDGIIGIPSLLNKAAKLNMPAIAITDLNNLYATVKFYQNCFEVGLKPIIGADIHVCHPKNPQHAHRLTLLCQNNLGYRNLIKIISRSYLEGQQSGRPMVEKDWLNDMADGLIALSGAECGDIGEALLTKEKKLANQNLQHWRTLFGNRFYLEVSRVGKIDEERYIKEVLKLAEKNAVPIVATNDVRFLERDEYEAHEARVCIQDGAILTDQSRPRHYTDQQYLRSPAEMQALFADMPEAIQNTVEIAKRCNVTFELGKSRLPHFPVPQEHTIESFLTQLAQLGLEERLKTLFKNNIANIASERKVYDERLSREIAVINAMGFAGYFLIVADFVKWAKDNGVPLGPGRGSGPGSLVAYSLNITDLNPIAFDLLFERFLNPERVSMPDFDIDFCMEGRDRVIEYVMQKHGAESVSQIITYGTMAARAVVRDVGRVLGLAYGYVDKIAKLIPFELGITLDKAMAQEPMLRERYDSEDDVRTLIDLARKLEGITRNVGKHAGGIVIAPGKLTDFVPLYCEANEPQHPVTQFDKDDVEAVGLVKFDFLGLKTLTIIDRALRKINQHQTPIDINLIPLDDSKTFDLLKACKSTAVFQLESVGMRDLIKRLQPDCFEDLIALVALFRPGPLQSGMVDDFINRKHGRAKVIYPHPELEPILRPTYGVILYQEQVMQIAQILAGYTLGAADILRRAMGKKKPEEMAKQREIFCSGATERGVASDVANHIFDLMEKFAGYGFNKSHSASYALIAYQTAWLKTHYKAAFMAAVLSSEMDRTEKIIILLDECESMKLHVSPPDINNSDYYFKVIDDQHLVYGLGAIKGVGESAIENILTAREEKPFKNLFDFCERVDLRKVNRRVVEALIKSGCFDAPDVHRAQLLASLNNALQHAEQSAHNRLYGQHDLLGSTIDNAAIKYVEVDPWSTELQLQGEKETLGFYLTGHPLNRYLNEIVNFTTARITDITTKIEQVRVAGIITNLRTRQTKRGDRIAVFTLDDGTTPIEVVCFSECFLKHRSIINEDQIIIVEGDVSLDTFNNSPRIVSRELYTIDEARARFAKSLCIVTERLAEINIDELQQIFASYHGGRCEILIRFIHGDVKADIKFNERYAVAPKDALIHQLQAHHAISNVEFIY